MIVNISTVANLMRHAQGGGHPRLARDDLILLGIQWDDLIGDVSDNGRVFKTENSLLP